MATPNNNFDPTTLPGVTSASSGSFDPTSLPGVTASASNLTPGAPGNTTGRDVISGVGNFLFPIVGDVINDFQGKGKPWLQQVGDAGLSALPFIPGLGEIGEAARVGKGAVEGVSTLSKL